MTPLRSFASCVAVVAGLLAAACGGDGGALPTPTPASTVSPTVAGTPTPDLRAEPDACRLVTTPEVEAATKKTLSSTQQGTKPPTTGSEVVSFCNFLTAEAGGTVVAQLTWWRSPEAAAKFKEGKPQTARDIPGLGDGAYQDQVGVFRIVVKDSLVTVSVVGADQAAVLSASLEIAQKAVRRVE
ncbi:MAG: hypothetical protein ACKVVT_06950 [Dehalococcoidia bacterium]